MPGAVPLLAVVLFGLALAGCARLAPGVGPGRADATRPDVAADPAAGGVTAADRPLQGGALVDAVLAVVDLDVVAASDIALARALGLHGFAASPAPITTADVERFVNVLLVLGEARRLAIQAPEAEVEDAWRTIEAEAGGPVSLDAWLNAVAVPPAWARRAVEAHVRWRRFVRLRFVELTFVMPDEVTAALGPGAHDGEARARVHAQLREAKAEAALAEWLDARSRTAQVRRVLAPDETVPLPFAGPWGPP
jgi:hypothetical protein